MSPQLVSVVLPVFNGERFLACALDSVLAQTYHPLEIIVVDDGSTDASAALAAGIPLVRYHFQSNAGTGAARNSGVRLAQGSYLAFLDQDDVWLADKLTFQLEYLMTDPALDGVFGWVTTFRAGTPGAWLTAATNQPREGYSPSALLIRRDAFLRAGLFETHWQVGEWAEWYVRAIDRGLRFGMPPQVVARRGVHAANKGFVSPHDRVEYVRILKAALERRRKAAPVRDMTHSRVPAPDNPHE